MKIRWLQLLCITFISVLFISTGCHRNFSNDPVKWSFISSDGSWDNSSRKWSVNLSPGEIKSAQIRLDNTGSDTMKVLIQLELPANFITGHLYGPFVYRTDNVLDIPGGGSAVFNTSVTANPNTAPKGSHKYVIDLSWSTDAKIQPLPTTNSNPSEVGH